MKKFFTSAAVAAIMTGAAYAQTATEFYVVQDTSTKKCTIMDKKPTIITTLVVGDKVFKTRTEAETGMKTMKVCTN